MNACMALANTIRTTLGPRGMDKLISGSVNSITGEKSSNTGVTISNDGATIMKLLQVEHPAARALVDVSMSQDAEVGDGTTSVVLITASVLDAVKPFVEEGVHPCVIMRYVREAADLAVQLVQQHAHQLEDERLHEMLKKCACTALNSKLISSHEDLFAPMIVDAVLSANLDESESNSIALREVIAIKKVPGGDVRQSFLVKGGVAFKKTFSYAGFEQMKKRFEKPKVLLLNVELELKNEKENAEVRISDPEAYQSIVDAEWNIIYDKLNACVDAGANVVLSKLPIGDLATQFFADRGMFCAGRVENGDLKRVAKATGAIMQTSVSDLRNNAESVLGTCALFEEKQVGDERFNIFTFDDSNEALARTSTIVLRGGSEQFIAESERSVHDALMVVSRAVQSQSVVAGGGAIEMVVAEKLRQHSLSIEGKGQLIVAAFAKALEVVPRQLAENAGFDSTDVLSALRKAHSNTDGDDGIVDRHHFGVDIVNGGICNTYENGVWEPAVNKINSLASAAEAAVLILSIDETVRNPRSQAPDATGAPPPQDKPLTNMMGNAMDAVNAANGGSRSGNLGNGVSYMRGRGGG